jgi:hypothetical protein
LDPIDPVEIEDHLSWSWHVLVMAKVEHNLAKDASQENESAYIIQKLTWTARPNGPANLLNPGDTPPC